MSLITDAAAASAALCAAAFDLDAEMRICSGFLSFEDGKIYARISRDGAELTEACTAVENIEALCVLSRVGSGLVYAKLKPEAEGGAGAELVLCRFTLGHMKEMGEFCKVVNYYILNGVMTGMGKLEKRACEKCGRPFMSGLDFCIFCINKTAVLKRAIGLMKPVAAPMIISGIVLTLTQLLYVTVPLINRTLIDNHLKPQKGVLSEILLLVGLMFFVRALGEVVNIVNSRVFNRASSSFTRSLRDLAYEKVQSFTVASMSKKTAGDILRRVMSDTRTINSFLSDQGRWAFEQLIVFIGVFIILMITNPFLTMLVFVPVPFVAAFAAWFWPFIHRRYERQWAIFSRSTSVLHDIIKGIRVVKCFGTEEREVEKFSKTCRDLAEVSASNEMLWSRTFPLLGFIASIGQYLVLYFGGKAVLAGQGFTVGDLMLFTMFIGYIYGPLRWLVSFPRWFAEALTSMVKVFEVLDEEPEIKEAREPAECDMRSGISFDSVTFGYKPYEPVLKDVSFDIRPGEMIGLVGHSGVGKSTLINLIMRLYDVDSGKISIGGVDLREISQKQLHESIGVVFQETFLFAGSIYDNIAYAKPGASCEEIIAAAKVANAHEFIMRLPDTYNTVVGENGYSLSGGERQRLAIARAILRDPAILILDEATSSLDVETESKIQEALGRLIKGRTTIAIAHRLATLRHADRLIVLDKGKLAEFGTHSELLQKRGIYYNLVMAQRQTTKLTS